MWMKYIIYASSDHHQTINACNLYPTASNQNTSSFLSVQLDLTKLQQNRSFDINKYIIHIDPQKHQTKIQLYHYASKEETSS